MIDEQEAQKLHAYIRRLRRRVAELENQLTGVDETGAGPGMFSKGVVQVNQFVIDHLNEAILTTDSQGRLVNVNETACQLFQLSRNRLSELVVTQLIGELSDSESDLDWFSELRYRKSYQREIVLRGADQAASVAEALLVHFKSGEVEYACILIRDISHQKKVEEAFRQSDDALRALLSAIPDMMLRLERDGTCLDFKSPHDQSLVSDPQQLVGSSIRSVMSDESADEMIKAIENSLDSQSMQVIEYSLARPRGDSRQYEARIAPINSQEVLCIVRDITDQKHSEQVRDELIHQLELKNSELERFTYTVSHDLKSPLITIKGFLDLLRKDLSEDRLDEVVEHIDEISSASDKMKTLLNQLLELSRIGRVTHHLERLPFEELVREALELVRGQIEQQQIKVVLAPKFPEVFGDRLRLVEVLQNLIDNATAFMGDQPSPRIEIGIRADSGQNVFYVRDNGIGIEPRFHEKVFGLFERLNRRENGTGIGLAIVQRIVQLHGGRVWVESEGLGTGSTFCWTLAGDPTEVQAAS